MFIPKKIFFVTLFLLIVASTVSAADHTHFNTEKVKSGVINYKAYRSTSEIQADYASLGGLSFGDKGSAYYDAGLDGAVMPVIEGIPATARLENDFPSTGGVIWVQWEMWVDQDFFDDLPQLDSQYSWHNFKVFRFMDANNDCSFKYVDTIHAAYMKYENPAISYFWEGEDCRTTKGPIQAGAGNGDRWRRWTVKWDFPGKNIDVWVTEMNGTTEHVYSVHDSSLTATHMDGAWPILHSSKRDDRWASVKHQTYIFAWRNIIASTQPIAFTTGEGGGDTTQPQIAISTPDANPFDNGANPTITVSGTASDNEGVAQVTWSSSSGGSGTATGTTNWAVSNINLSEGNNVITVTASDAAGNSKTDTVTVSYTEAGGSEDTTSPAVSITSPGTDPYDNGSNSRISVSGSASDNVAVTQVTWSNNTGGSGTASGTANWTISGIGLSEGNNVITVTAYDAVGNTDTDSISVTYSAAVGDGDVFYIDQANGNDNNAGTSAGSAWKTFSNINGSSVGPGDSILLKRGQSWNDTLTISKDGTAAKPIRIGAYGSGEKPVVNELYIAECDYITVEDLIVDHNKAASDAVRIRGTRGSTLRRLVIRNGTRDGVDIARAVDFLIDSSEIHHFLAGSFDNQVDAHGIVATKSQGITIRNSEIHHVSGDCFQADPERDETNLTNDILIEGCHFWTGPLTEEFNSGWVKTSHLSDSQKQYPGENAVDTKVLKEGWESYDRMRITMKNIVAHGWRSDSYIANKAAFNLKENIEAVLDGITVYDSEIAFRLRGTRGGANVTIMNAVIYDNEKAIRSEDDLANLKIHNSTFGTDLDTLIQHSGGSGGTGSWELLNNVFIDNKISEANDSSNKIVPSNNLTDNFVDAGTGNYRLKSGSVLIDAGDTLAGVTIDRDGRNRSSIFDVGAYEFDGDGELASLPAPFNASGYEVKN